MNTGTVARKPVLTVTTRLPGETHTVSIQQMAAAQSYPGPVVTELSMTWSTRSMVGVVETVSDSDGYHSDFKDYDPDLSPRKFTVEKWHDDRRPDQQPRFLPLVPQSSTDPRKQASQVRASSGQGRG